MSVNVVFDLAKAAANLRKHGVSFADAEAVLHDPLALTIDDADSRGECRRVTVGADHAGALLVVVWTEREGRYRIISARHATRTERKAYES